MADLFAPCAIVMTKSLALLLVVVTPAWQMQLQLQLLQAAGATAAPAVVRAALEALAWKAIAGWPCPLLSEEAMSSCCLGVEACHWRPTATQAMCSSLETTQPKIKKSKKDILSSVPY